MDSNGGIVWLDFIIWRIIFSPEKTKLNKFHEGLSENVICCYLYIANALIKSNTHIRD